MPQAVKPAVPTLDDSSPAGYEARTRIEEEILQAQKLVAVLHYAHLGHTVTTSGDDYPPMPKAMEQAFDYGIERMLELLEAHFATIRNLAYHGVTELAAAELERTRAR